MKAVAKFAMLSGISRLSAHNSSRIASSVTLRQHPILFGKSLCPSGIEFDSFFVPMSFCHSASSSGVVDVGFSRFGSLRTGGIKDTASFRPQNPGNFDSSLKLSFCNWKKRQSVVTKSRRMIRSSNVECSAQAGANEQSSSSPSSVLPDVKSTVVGQRIIFCPRCGGTTERKVPGGEHELRVVCTVCNAVHYENPKMVSTLPAGYMEIGESAAEGAARETWEEACAEVEVLGLFAHLDIPFIGQVVYPNWSSLKLHSQLA
ncbi:hypothetical protein R1sor_009488 [Riccia sorocarpa]|uniref:Nudix hydrolase domain-containing protein n=1 Tax=Riccia sorocarpa TaxID=122646 RepID=A0ABD3HYU0_9MARC